MSPVLIFLAFLSMSLTPNLAKENRAVNLGGVMILISITKPRACTVIILVQNMRLAQRISGF